MPCQTTLQFGEYCIHQEENTINPVNLSSSPPRVLVSGASGMLGTALREALAVRGFSILQLVRCKPQASHQLQWTPDSTPSIPHPRHLEDLAAAFHFSGANLAAHQWTPTYKQELTRSRVTSTRALAAALAGLNRPPKVLFVASAVGIYGDRGDELLDETSRMGRGFLAELCERWEEAAQPAREAGIRVVHLRFGVVLGPGLGTLARLLPIFRLGLGGKLGSGRQYISWIALADALEAIFYLLNSPTAAGPYNFTAPNPLTNAEFTRILAAHLHRPAMFGIPKPLLRLVFGEMADEVLLASTRAYPARLAAAGFQFTYPTLVHALPVILAPSMR